MSDDAKINALIGRWISDYRSRALWKIFDENGHLKSVDSKNFDVSAPVLRQTEGAKGSSAPILAADDVELRSWLLVELMRRLANGRETTVTSSAGVVGGGPPRSSADKVFDRTALEEAVDILDRVVEETNVSDLVTHSDVSRLRLALKRQAVYVCCRAGKFDLAVAVFERQWTHWKNEREMDVRRQVSEVTAARNKDHPALADEPYGALVNEGRSFLRKAFSALPVPFLVKATHNVCEKIDKLSTTPSPNITSEESPVATTPSVGKKANENLSSSAGGQQSNDSAGKIKRGRPPRFSSPPGSAPTKIIMSPVSNVPAEVGSKEGSRPSRGFVQKEIKTEKMDGESDTDVQDEEPSSSTKKRKRDSTATPEVDSSTTKEKRVTRKESVSWSTEDEELIFVGALKYGVGRWSDIARALPGRSHLDIKEKWRTMLQQGKVELYEKIHGSLPPTDSSASL